MAGLGRPCRGAPNPGRNLWEPTSRPRLHANLQRVQLAAEDSEGKERGCALRCGMGVTGRAPRWGRDVTAARCNAQLFLHCSQLAFPTAHLSALLEQPARPPLPVCPIRSPCSETAQSPTAPLGSLAPLLKLWGKDLGLGPQPCPQLSPETPSILSRRLPPPLFLLRDRGLPGTFSS